MACKGKPTHDWIKYWPGGRPRCWWFCTTCRKKRRGKFKGH